MAGMAGEDVADSLSETVYRRLRTALMRAELLPGQRLKVRDLARDMGTSETPVREALIQLAHDGAIEIKPRFYIRVRRLSYAAYCEIRDIRLELEPMAAERAIGRLEPGDIDSFAHLHDTLVAAEDSGDWRRALQANFEFHFGIYGRSGLPALTDIIGGLWVRVGPTLSQLYPEARPVYAEEHQHLAILDALRRSDAPALRMAIRMDLIEGGRRLRRHLAELEKSGQPNPAEPARAADPDPSSRGA